MKKILAVEEFAQVLRRYMKKFSLEPIDIAYLANSIKKNIASLLGGNGSLQIETAEAIAQAFGLRYFQFGNPDTPIPSLKHLPEKTKQRIAYRKKEGPAVETTYSPSDINHQIDDALSTYKQGEEFLVQDIAKTILKEHKEVYSVSQIADRISKSFKERVEKTERKDTSKEGPGPKPVFYKLKKSGK